jgi:radical SAM peptide maturase (CXXX-repeat target family)
LKKYNNFLSFTISIDGNKELHDSCRIDLHGMGSYDRAILAVKDYNNRFGKNPATKMTVSPENINFLVEALISLMNNNYTTIMVNCIYEKGWNNFYAKILYEKLKIIADYLIYNNLYNKYFIRFFDEDNFQPMEENENSNWCGGVDNLTLAVDYKGDIYPCIRYMESSLNGTQKPLKIGSVNYGLLNTDEEKENNQLISNITRRSQSTDECFYCPIASGCSWCSAYNYEEFGTPNKRATHICCMHKAASLVNVYYWNTLYKYLNINKTFKMYLPKEEALKIIDEEEYNYLLKLSKE